MSRHINRVARDVAIEQSLDAALEINQVLAGDAGTSPALSKLIVTLMGADQSSPSLQKDLLRDPQLASISQRAAAFSGRNYQSAQELANIVNLLLRVSSVGLENFDKQDLELLRDFCVGLNQSFLTEAASRTTEPPFAQNKIKGTYAN